MVLSWFAKYRIRLRQHKCSLSVKKVHYLGFVISDNGLQMSDDKVNAIVNTPVPSDVPTLQSFMGLVNFYHCFVPGTSTILHPLNQLLRKDAEWNWSAECIAAFDRIKQLIVAASVLAHYDLSKPLILESDASPVGSGACLLQEESDGSRIPVHFILALFLLLGLIIARSSVKLLISFLL